MKPLAGGAIADASLALKFILSNPDVSVAIPGMESVEQVAANLSVSGQPLTSFELAEIEKSGILSAMIFAGAAVIVCHAPLESIFPRVLRSRVIIRATI